MVKMSWDNDDILNAPTYKHIYECSVCDWVKCVCSFRSSTDLELVKEQHWRQKPCCSGKIHHKSTSETTFGHPDNFKEDTS